MYHVLVWLGKEFVEAKAAVIWIAELNRSSSVKRAWWREPTSKETVTTSTDFAIPKLVS
jgi:hypothetical protein